MSCFHPSLMTYLPDGFKLDGSLARNKDGSVRHWKFQGSAFEFQDENGELVFKLENKPNTVVYPFGDISSTGEIEYSLLVPCKQCRGCRIDYARHWADRIVMESLTSLPHSCFFVTLTYNQESLLNNFTGYSFEHVYQGNTYEISAATLIKKDLQDFNKRLREEFRSKYGHTNIRFYAAGEYGSMSRRPHYHVCYFNLPIQDLEYYTTNFQGDKLYTSPTLERLWGKGYVVIGELTWESAAYTARYVVKKFKGQQAEKFYYDHGHVLPEFCLMSNRPGLGGDYYEQHKVEIYKYDHIQLPSSDKRDGLTSVPRYFDKLLEKYQAEHPDDDSIEKIEKIKAQRRQLSDNRSYSKRIISGMFDKEYFSCLEKKFEERTKGLYRSLDI